MRLGDQPQAAQWDLFWVAGILLFEVQLAIETQCEVPYAQQHRYDPNEEPA